METIAFNRELSAWLAQQFGSSVDEPLSGALARWRGISPQAANGQLRKLVETGVLRAQPRGRTKFYRLRALRHATISLEREKVQEDRIWSDIVAPELDGFAEPAAMRVLEYGVTEMVNNARDHSDGTTVTVRVHVDMAFGSVVVVDDGEGIFARIRRLCGLHDERESLLELAKGKLTTDPERHSGEGVFFSSRALDRFAIHSGGLSFSHMRGRDDFLFDHDDSIHGTTVLMRHAHTSLTELKSVFDEYAAPEEYTFSKTVVPLRLAVFGNENLMSRSQARRVLARMERFRSVLLDFEGVPFIGQAFADEIFRVFARQHPDMELVPINTNAEVGQMVSRAMAGRAATE